MKLSPEEKAAHRAAFRAMSPAKKLDHIYTYYKWPILLGVVALVILGSLVHRQLTRKEPVLYLAFANVAVGSDLETALTEDYLLSASDSPRRQEVSLYKELYLSEDADTLNHEYAYASQIKLMGALQAQKLDLLVMNREAYDYLSARGYLLDWQALLQTADPSLREAAEPLLVSNEVILEDNAVEWMLGEAETHRQTRETVTNGLELTELPLFRRSGFPERLYLAAAGNSPRSGRVLEYLGYLLGAE